MQTMSVPFFRPFEIERFLSFLHPQQFQNLADDIAYEALKKTQIGYQVVYTSETPPIPDFPMACITQEVDLDHNFKQILANLITPHLIGGFSNHSALPKKDTYDTVCYLDIPLVSEDGMGLLEQLKHSYDGKYLAAIESLKERESKPITSLTCRFRLHEHLVESGCRLCFECEFMINGARGTTTIGFG